MTRSLRFSSFIVLAGSMALASGVCAGAPGTVRSAFVADSMPGIRDAASFPGADIGEKINAAFASCGKHACTVFVPAGDYTYKTTIVMPAVESPTLEMDNGAYLRYAGDGRALSTSEQTGRVHIRGGHLVGNPNAKAGIVLLPIAQGIYIDDTDVNHFERGDGVLDLGANVVKLTNMQIRKNEFGVHLMGANGFASNAVTVMGSTITENSRWGIIDGDVTQFPANWMGTGLPAGVSSPNLNNIFLNDDLEANGSDPVARTGVVLEGLTYKSVYSGNYFENSVFHRVQLGCLAHEDPEYQRLYGIRGPNCGTSVSPTVRDNYFTAGAPINVEIFAARDAIIEGNAELGHGNGCFASVTGAAVNAYADHNSIEGNPAANHGQGEWLYCHGSGGSLTRVDKL